MNNRLHNVSNPHQGAYRKVLCVCSAGLLRSPTTALVLSQEPYNYNTRAVGITEDYALVPVDEALLAWADEVVCVDRGVARVLKVWHADVMEKYRPELVVLDIPDRFAYRDPELVDTIKAQYAGATTESYPYG